MVSSNPTDVAKLRAELEEFAQQHVFQYWEQLSVSDRSRLCAQLESVDLKLIRDLYESWRGGGAEDWAAVARKAEPPRAIRPGRHAAGGSDANAVEVSAADARQQGSEALHNGHVGVLLVAGGQGSRLGFEKPKGLFPIGPVSNASLFQIHCEKVLATSQRYGVSVPLYLMTSPATHEETLTCFEQNQHFGLPPQDVKVFCQGTMPAVDAHSGKLLLEDCDRLFMSPDGHGGTVAALAKSGALQDAQRRRIEHLFYFQVDNPLTPVCDPEILGYHLLARSELSSIAVAKELPLDPVGNFVSIDGRLRVIEYIDFPEDVAAQRAADGSLKFWAGNTAIHVFDVAFLMRILNLSDALPFHIQHKKVPHLGEGGRRIEPEKPNALKFERFIFDLLPHAQGAIVIEADEEQVFAPLKNAPGSKRDTPQFVQQRMIKLHRQWLTAAGATVDNDVPVEISPLFALDGEALKSKLQLPLRIESPTFFD